MIFYYFILLLGFFIIKMGKELSRPVLSFEGMLHRVPGGGKDVSVYSIVRAACLFLTGLGAIAFICSLIQKYLLGTYCMPQALCGVCKLYLHALWYVL